MGATVSDHTPKEDEIYIQSLNEGITDEPTAKPSEIFEEKIEQEIDKM